MEKEGGREEEEGGRGTGGGRGRGEGGEGEREGGRGGRQKNKHTLLHEWSWYFQEPKGVKVQPTSAIRDMQANECNKVFIIRYHNSVMSSHTKYKRSNTC